MNNVWDFIAWKLPAEELWSNETSKLGWKKTDTLYEFHGIYILGLKACYPKEYEQRGEATIEKIGTTKNISLLDIKNSYEDHSELNQLLEKFIKVYLSIGNLIPIWDGGNTHRSWFGIPELHFPECAETATLLSDYKNAFMKHILNNERKIKSSALLHMDKEKYKVFLNYVVNNITDRTSEIEEVLALSLEVPD